MSARILGFSLLSIILVAEADADDRSRPPVVSDIPVIRFLFRGEEHSAQTQNLIIMLTPRILDDTHG